MEIWIWTYFKDRATTSPLNAKRPIEFPIELSQSALSFTMAHDVFISHAHKDINIAKAICERLESAQIKCWLAERDISAGEDGTAATRRAIGSSRAVVLL